MYMSAVSCFICNLLMCVCYANGDHIVEAYLSICLVVALYVASIISFYSPNVVVVNALSICNVLHAFVVVLSIFFVCEFCVDCEL